MKTEGKMNKDCLKIGRTNEQKIVKKHEAKIKPIL